MGDKYNITQISTAVDDEIKLQLSVAVREEITSIQDSEPVSFDPSRTRSILDSLAETFAIKFSAADRGLINDQTTPNDLTYMIADKLKAADRFNNRTNVESSTQNPKDLERQ